MRLFILATLLALSAPAAAHAHPSETVHAHPDHDHADHDHAPDEVPKVAPDQAAVTVHLQDVQAAAEDLCSTIGIRVGPGLKCAPFAVLPATTTPTAKHPVSGPPDPEATRGHDHDCNARCMHEAVGFCLDPALRDTAQPRGEPPVLMSRGDQTPETRPAPSLNVFARDALAAEGAGDPHGAEVATPPLHPSPS